MQYGMAHLANKVSLKPVAPQHTLSEPFAGPVRRKVRPDGADETS